MPHAPRPPPNDPRSPRPLSHAGDPSHLAAAPGFRGENSYTPRPMPHALHLMTPGPPAPSHMLVTHLTSLQLLGTEGRTATLHHTPPSPLITVFSQLPRPPPPAPSHPLLRQSLHVLLVSLLLLSQGELQVLLCLPQFLSDRVALPLQTLHSHLHLLQGLLHLSCTARPASTDASHS